MTAIERFVLERNEALLSLDEQKIKAFCEKNGMEIPENEEVFWCAVHKAICNLDIPTRQKANSLFWLDMHGYSPEVRDDS